MADRVSVSEAKARLYKLIDRVVHQKERFIITRRGKEVALLLPFEEIEAIFDDEFVAAKPVPAGGELEIRELPDILGDD